MFLTDAIKIWRFVPSPLPLVCACTPPGFILIKIQYALPTKFLAEDRAQLLCAMIDRTHSMRACPFVLVVGETDRIIIFDAFTRPFGGILRVGEIIAEAR